MTMSSNVPSTKMYLGQPKSRNVLQSLSIYSTGQGRSLRWRLVLPTFSKYSIGAEQICLLYHYNRPLVFQSKCPKHLFCVWSLLKQCYLHMQMLCLQNREHSVFAFPIRLVLATGDQLVPISYYFSIKRGSLNLLNFQQF